MMGTKSPLSTRPLVLVGMMGSGKSAVGRRLASRLGWPFLDSDTEIETAAGMTIAAYFEKFGEAAFREGERRVIFRLLTGAPCVLSTGGGAFMDPVARDFIRQRSLVIWLKADLETLVRRTADHHDRPLLRGDNPREKLATLLKIREPVYAEADLHIASDDRPPDDTASRVLQALETMHSEHVSTP